MKLIYAFRSEQSGYFWLKLAVSMFYILEGLFLLLNPTTGTASLASAVRMLFTAMDIFENCQAFQTRGQERLS